MYSRDPPVEDEAIIRHKRETAFGEEKSRERLDFTFGGSTWAAVRVFGNTLEVTERVGHTGTGLRVKN